MLPPNSLAHNCNAGHEDLRLLARRRVPQMFYDYVDSGSWTESTYRANERELAAICLRQRVAVNIENRSLRSTMIGADVAMPVALAPTGLSGATPIIRKLERLNLESETSDAQKPAPPILLKAGTRLVCEWRGVTHTVLVHADGFEWNGRRYRSLTIVAREISACNKSPQATKLSL